MLESIASTEPIVVLGLVAPANTTFGASGVFVTVGSGVFVGFTAVGVADGFAGSGVPGVVGTTVGVAGVAGNTAAQAHKRMKSRQRADRRITVISHGDIITTGL